MGEILRLFPAEELNWGAAGADVDVSLRELSGNVVLEQGPGNGLLLAEDDCLIIADPADNTRRGRIDVGAVAAGQTRVLSLPDVNVDLATTPGNQSILDPGTGNAIPVTSSGFLALTVGTGAETNTLAAPTTLGQELGISVATLGMGGSRAITVASAINQAGDTIMTFAAVDDTILLRAFQVGAGALSWRVVANDGAALS